MSAVIDADTGSQLLYAGDEDYLAVNLDTANTVFLSQARTVYPTDVPLPPQASVQLTGPWYVSTCGGPVTQVAVLPGSAGGYSNPVGVQIALDTLGLAKDSSVNNPAYGPAKDASVTAVKTTLGSPAQDASVTAVKTTLGSPAQDASVTAVKTTLGSPAQDVTLTNGNQLAAGITKSASIVNIPSSLVSAGAQSFRPVSGFYTISRPSYEIALSFAENVAGGNAGPVTIELDWFDSASGQQVAAEYWTILPAALNAKHLIMGRGPTKGDNLTITITNNDNVQIVYSMTLIQSSRFYSEDSWFSQDMTVVGSYTLPNFNVPGMLIAGTAPSVAGNGSQMRLMPLYAGSIVVAVNPFVASWEVAINELDPNVTFGTRIFGAVGGSLNTQTFGPLILPRSQCTLTLFNHTSSAGQINMSVSALPNT